MLYKFYLNSFMLGLSYSFLTVINTYRRTSLVVQGLRLHAPNVGEGGQVRSLFRELDSIGHN